MSNEIALENIAIGEANLIAAGRTIAACLRKNDDDETVELYEALRAWTWKALESRRRDDELPGWLDIFGRVSSHLEDRWQPLAHKLEGFAELLQASIVASSAPDRRNLAGRKHVREILIALYHSRGRLPRQALVEKLRLKDANLSRVAAPLQDDGWIQRELLGREVFYRLTEKGRSQCLLLIAQERKGREGRPSSILVRPWLEHLNVERWKDLGDEAADNAVPTSPLTNVNMVTGTVVEDDEPEGAAICQEARLSLESAL